jgi:hypothetical protein
MPRWLILVMAAVVMVVSAPSVAADPQWPRHIGWKGCPAPSWPKAGATGTPANRVLIVGDSLTRESRTSLERRLSKDAWVPTIRCWGGKRLDWGISQLKRAKKLGQLPDTVVIALGTNDMRLISPDVTKVRMQQLLDIVGPQRDIMWLTVHFEGGLAPGRAKEQWFNNELRTLAATRDNLHVIEWATFARNANIRTRDGLHYRWNGHQARAEIIRQSLAELRIPQENSATRVEILH